MSEILLAERVKKLALGFRLKAEQISEKFPKSSPQVIVAKELLETCAGELEELLVADPVVDPQLREANKFLKKIGGAVVILFFAARCFGSVVTEPFLDRLEQLESGGRSSVLGDGGRARGSFQLWRAAWDDVSVRFAVPGYQQATNRAWSRFVAREYLRLLESRLSRCLHRDPSNSELYAAWNVGFSRFQRNGFSLAKCPKRTQRNANKFGRELR